MDFNNKFWNFQSMVSTQIIKNIYFLGVMLITFGGGVVMFTDWILYGLVIIVAGNLVWRITCEAFIILFSIHEILSKILDNIGGENQQS